MRLGQEQKDVRALLRDFTARKIAQTWRTGVDPSPVTDDAQTVIVTMIAGAFSVSIALNLIFDMDRPFAGFIKISSVPMRRALEKMKP
jgi:hypothetical protein